MTRQHLSATAPTCEQAFASAIELAPVGIALCSLESRVEYANAALCELLGYRRGELLALGFDALVDGEGWARQAPRMRRLLAGSEARLQSEVRCLRRDGVGVWAELTCTLLRGETGRPVQFMVHVRDITRQRATQSAT